VSTSNIMAAHDKEICALSLSPDGARLVSASKDSTLRIWDADSCQCLKSLECKDVPTALVVVPAACLALTGATACITPLKRTLHLRDSAQNEFPEVHVHGDPNPTAREGGPDSIPSHLVSLVSELAREPSAEETEMALDVETDNPAQDQAAVAERWAAAAIAMYNHSAQGIIKAIVQ
jgi:WD40 repeat protein